LFGPDYRPSPGSIYPALTALEAEGLIESSADSDRKAYAVTAMGQDVLRARSGLLADLENRTGTRLTGSETLQPAIDRFVSRVRELAGAVDAATLERLLDEAAQRVEELARREEVR
jgi:DNA-binding PadR family transcriptional regulator